MAITSLSGKAIQPTQAKTAIYDGRGTSTTATQNTWYTILNVSSGKGTFNRVSAVVDTGSVATNRYTEIRITIDGVSNILTNSFSTANVYYNGLRGFDHTSTATVVMTPTGVFEYSAQLFFFQSLLVEVRQTQTGTPYIQAIIDYALV